MKKPKAVIDAEAVVAEKVKELAAAQEVVARLDSERIDAMTAVRKAQEEVDSDLPQCRMVSIQWRSGKEQDAGSVVIVRSTPSGMIITRQFGNTSGHEYKFKWSPYTSQFRQAENGASFGNTRALRDVPDAYLPAEGS